MRVDRICGHTFLPSLFKSAGVIVDCGANRGVFARQVARKYNASVISFEPDPRYFAELSPEPRVSYYPFAVSWKGGELDLYMGENTDSSIVFPDVGHKRHKVTAIDLEQFFQSERIDLIKLDIEGAEIEVLSHLSDRFLDRVTQLTVEFHDFISPDQLPLIRDVIVRLKSQGFEFIRFSYHDFSDCLFINQKIHKLSPLDNVLLRIHKLVSGIRRMLKRNSFRLSGERP